MESRCVQDHARRAMNDNISELAPPLTDRQQAIARALIRRTPIKQIASDLEIAPSTVNDHIKTIKRKFGVRSTAQLVAALLGEPAIKAPSNEGGTNNRLPMHWSFGDESSRDRDGSFMLSDSVAPSSWEPWKPAPESRVVPEELDGPDATIPRLLEIGKILAWILAGVVLTILAFQAVMGIVNQGVASGQ